MGTICSGNDSSSLGGEGGPATMVADKVTQPKKMKVYGHCFDSDTRSVLTLLQIAKIDHDYHEIDIFAGKHKEVSYLMKNPCGTIPMVTDQDCQLMGSINVFVNYLTASKPKLQ